MHALTLALVGAYVTFYIPLVQDTRACTGPVIFARDIIHAPTT
jgi:hypothetical protein